MNINLINNSLLIRSDGTIFALDEKAEIKRFLGIGKSFEEKAISFGQMNEFKWICTNKNLSLFDCKNSSWTNKTLGKMQFSSKIDDYPSIFSVAGNVNTILVQGVDHLYSITISAKQINEFTIPNKDLFFSGWWEDNALYLAGMTKRQITGSFPSAWGNPVLLKISGEHYEIVTPDIALDNKARQKFGIDKNVVIEGILDTIFAKDTVLMICPLITKIDDPYLLYKDFYLDYPVLDDYGEYVVVEYVNGCATPVEHFLKNEYAGKIANKESVYCYFPDSSDHISNGVIPLSVLMVDTKNKNRKIVSGAIKGLGDLDPYNEINFYRFLYDEKIGFYGCIEVTSIDFVLWFSLQSENGILWNAVLMEREVR